MTIHEWQHRRASDGVVEWRRRAWLYRLALRLLSPAPQAPCPPPSPVHRIGLDRSGRVMGQGAQRVNKARAGGTAGPVTTPSRRRW